MRRHLNNHPTDNKPPVNIPRKDHCITRGDIHRNALTVLYGLKKAGFEAYLVGGGVRDLLLGSKPKDFDVVTNALPEQIKQLFHNCRLIGRRFRLAHVYFSYDYIEVATFRGSLADATQHEDHQQSEHGMIIRDNVYGTLSEDAARRDYTINALYYNIADFSIVDFTHGMADLKQRTLRIIGLPHERFREDPVRMLRGIRFASKLGFTLEETTAQALHDCVYLLEQISPARLFEEYVKLFFLGKAQHTFTQLREYNLFKLLFSCHRGCTSRR